MSSSKDNGSPAHIRYGHFYHPRLVELRCPQCTQRATATNVDAPPSVEHFMDLAQFKKEWAITCLFCTFRQRTNWEALRSLELYLKTEVRGLEIWAWNANHLTMILKRLKKEDLAADPWEAFATYIPRKWLLKLNCPSAFRKIERLLHEKP